MILKEVPTPQEYTIYNKELLLIVLTVRLGTIERALPV